jgi:hypothetical protein
MIVSQKLHVFFVKLLEYCFILHLSATSMMFVVDAVIFLHPRLGGLHPDDVAYDNTLAVLSAWSDPCGLGRDGDSKWVIRRVTRRRLTRGS